LARNKQGQGGFRDVLRSLKKSLPEKEPSSPAVPASAPPSVGFAEGSFEEEMARLEVTRLADPAASEVDEGLAPHAEPEPSAAPEHTPAEDDETLFLAALGNLDRVFRDQIDLQEEEDPQPRRLKSLGRRRIDPEEALDLHGLTRTEALHKVDFFLQKAFHNGLRSVLVVTGKGKGSEGEGVLRAAVAEFLDNEGGRWISAWGVAPRNLGGDGAVVVFPRTRPR
jgi:DNA-nicking Smr family endonuclease